jgi:hypothetical protein
MWDLPPPDPGFEIVVASRGMSKGVAQTKGIQVVPRGFIQLGTLQIGAQWKNVTSEVAAGEGAAFVNFAPKLGAFQLTVGAAYKFQTSVKGNPDDTSFEFTTAATRKFGRVSLRASAVYSPDDLGSARRSLYLEGGPTIDIDSSTRISANVARRSRVNGVDYTSWNAGLSKTLFKKVTLDARYYDTAQRELGETYDNRVVVSGRLAL